MLYVANSLTLQRLTAAGLRPLVRVMPVGAVRVMPLGERRWLRSNHCSENQGSPAFLTSQQKRILYRSKQVDKGSWFGGRFVKLSAFRS